MQARSKYCRNGWRPWQRTLAVR